MVFCAFQEGQCFAMITPFSESSEQLDTNAHEAYVKVSTLKRVIMRYKGPQGFEPLL